MFFLNKDIGLDLGTASVLVFMKGKGVVLHEPSVVAVDRNSGQLLKVGTDAQKMLGKVPGNIMTIRPLREGVISDYKMTEKMMRKFLHKAIGFNMIRPRIVTCVPSAITEVEECAILEAVMRVGARKVYLIEEPIAAAIGAGIDITKPNGNMIINIGGGTTNIAVISLGGIVESTSIKVAGDTFDSAFIKYMRYKHHMLIGDCMAEELKKNIGCVFPPPEEKRMEVKGRSLNSGLPTSFMITSLEMIEAFEEVTARIIEAIFMVLERTPPELVSDIFKNGIIMTGGGNLVWGFDKLIENKTGIATQMAVDAISCVACGTGKALERIKDMQYGVIKVSRKKQMHARMGQ